MMMLQKLKNRWGIESTGQVFMILLVFAITGYSSLFVRTFVFQLLGITPDFPFWQRAIIWMLTVLPAYNVLLITYGTLLGQGKFFRAFLKKTFGRFSFQSKNQKESTES